MGAGDLSDWGQTGKFEDGQLHADTAGSYVVAVSSSNGKPGAFTLTITGLHRSGGPIVVGKKAIGKFTTLSAAGTDDGTVSDLYTLSLKAKQKVTISVLFNFSQRKGQELTVVFGGKHYRSEFGNAPQTKFVTIDAGNQPGIAEIEPGTGNDLGLPVNIGEARTYTLSVALASAAAKISPAAEDASQDNGYGN
jgi:hypothetical protein